MLEILTALLITLFSGVSNEQSTPVKDKQQIEASKSTTPDPNSDDDDVDIIGGS